MSTKTLPIQYHLEVYENSFRNDPAVAFQADQPFQAFRVGDLVDPGLWDTQVSASPRTPYRIKDVIHRVWQIDDSHIGHQIGLCIEASSWTE